MPRQDISRGEMESVLEKYNGCLTRAAAHFTEFGKPITKEGVRKKCIRMGIQYNKETKNYAYLEKMKRIADEFPSYDTFERIEGDVLIVSDLHCPFFSPEWVCRALDVAKAQGIKKVIIAGDVLDGKSISSFKCADKSHTLQMEFTAVRQILMGFLEQFEEVYLLTGNHDERVARFTEQQFTLSYLYQHILPDRKLHVSEYAYCIVNGNIRVTHPYNYSSVPGSVPRGLASKYLQHIVMGHTHRVAVAYDASGKYLSCEIGGLFDASKFDWINLKDNRAPSWNNGFAIVKDNIITVFHDHTYWDSWM